MKTIDGSWLRKDFKQKYFLFCREKELKKENFIEKFGNLNNNSYICRIIIKEIEK